MIFLSKDDQIAQTFNSNIVTFSNIFNGLQYLTSVKHTIQTFKTRPCVGEIKQEISTKFSFKPVPVDI